MLDGYCVVLFYNCERDHQFLEIKIRVKNIKEVVAKSCCLCGHKYKVYILSDGDFAGIGGLASLLGKAGINLVDEASALLNSAHKCV